MARFHFPAHALNLSKPWRVVAPSTALFGVFGALGLLQGCASNAGTQPATSGSTSGVSVSGSSAATGTMATTGTMAPSGTTSGTSSGTATSGTVAPSGTTSGTSSGTATSGTVAPSGSSSGTAGSGTVVASGATSGTAGSGTTSGTATSGTTPPPACGGFAAAGGALPFVVDTKFYAAGWESDYQLISLNGGVANGPSTCPTRSSATAMGGCYGWTYNAVAAGGTFGDAGAVALGGAGVEWQAGGFNFGTAPGVIIPAGATNVSFWAKGAAGGESMTFTYGGLTNTLCLDAITGALPVILTTTWTNYTIPITGDYSAGMVQAFGWYANAQVNDAGIVGPLNFFIDDIEWK